MLLTGYAVFIFLAYGTTGAVARLIGAGNEREAAHQAVQGMWLALCIAAVLVPAGLLSGGWLVRALGASGELATNAEIYLRISMFGVPALLVTLAGTGYLRGRQDTFTPLAVALGSNVVNLVVELVLINGMGFGIGASALATVLAQTGAAAVYVGRVVRAVRKLDVSIAPDRQAIRLLGRAGGALLLRTAALRGSLTAATAIAARIGSVDVAAHEIAYELWSFLALGARCDRDRRPGDHRQGARRGRCRRSARDGAAHAVARVRRRRGVRGRGDRAAHRAAARVLERSACSRSPASCSGTSRCCNR